MTNKTQIAELRLRLNQSLAGSGWIEIVEVARDALEALEDKATHVTEQQNEISLLKTQFDLIVNSHANRVDKAEAELAAVRGATVPVAWTPTRWLDTRCKLSVWTDRKSAVLAIGDNSAISELFTHPAPPVVVLPTDEPFWTAVSDILEQSEMKGHNFIMGNVQVGRSAAKELATFLIETLGLIRYESADGEGE